MKDVPSVEGTPDPRQAGHLNKEGEIDPEKFKKIMKVDEADESEKKEKRNRPRKQEEDDDDVDEATEGPVPQTIFTDYMKESDPSTSILDIQGGSKPSLASSSEDSVSAPSPMSAYEDSRVPNAEPPAGEDLLDIDVPEDQEPLGEAKAPEFSQKEPVQKEPDANKNEMISKEKLAKEIKDLPKDAKITEKDLEKAEKSQTFKQAIEGEKPSDIKEHKHKVDLESQESKEPAIAPLPAEKKIAESTGTDEKKIEEKPVSAPEKKEQKESEDESEEKSEEVAAPGPLAPASSISEPAATGPSPFSHLSPEVFELFERMVGLMTIEKDKGLTTTTVKLNMPGSVFHEAKIVLEHHDAAKNAFNVTLMGSPKAVEKFTANMERLSNAFEQSKMGFDVNIRSPVLLEEYRYLVKKKGKVVKPDEKGRDKSDQ